MFRVAWWLLVAWAVHAAIVRVALALGVPDFGGVAYELLFYGVLFAVVAAFARHHTGDAWTELVPLRGMAPGLLIPILLATISGLVISAQMLVVCRAMNVLSPEVLDQMAETTASADPSRAPLLLLLVSDAVIPAVFEEATMRGLVMHALVSSMSRRRAIVISALFFAVVHGSIDRAPHTFFLGLFFGWMFARTGSLLPGIVAHAAYNAMVDLLGAMRSWPAPFGIDSSGFLPAWLVWTSVAMHVVGCVWFWRTMARSKQTGVRALEEPQDSYDLAA